MKVSGRKKAKQTKVHRIKKVQMKQQKIESEEEMFGMIRDKGNDLLISYMLHYIFRKMYFSPLLNCRKQ